MLAEDNGTIAESRKDCTERGEDGRDDSCERKMKKFRAYPPVLHSTTSAGAAAVTGNRYEESGGWLSEESSCGGCGGGGSRIFKYDNT